MASFDLASSCCLWSHPVGIISLSPVGKISLTSRQPSQYKEKIAIRKFANNILEYWKLNGNLIINDFGKPYFCIVFSC